MAQVKISLVYNVKTGQKDIIVNYESDADALPFEHEREHKDIIEKLIGANLLKAEEAGDIIIQRGTQATPDAAQPSQNPTQPQKHTT